MKPILELDKLCKRYPWLIVSKHGMKWKGKNDLTNEEQGKLLKTIVNSEGVDYL